MGADSSAPSKLSEEKPKAAHTKNAESVAVARVSEKRSEPAESKPNWLVTFFSDRPLAKIGGTLLFLGAVFFLSLVWAEV